MPNANNWPITISLPQGFTIGGVTTWAIGVARIMSRRGRRVRLVAHPPLAGHTEFHPRDKTCDDRIEIVRAPDLTTPDGFPESLLIYASLCPTILLPHLGPASYAVAAELTRSRTEDIRVIGWVHGDNPEDYAYLEYYEPIVARYAAVSRQCEHAMRLRLPHRERDIAHIPHAIEVPPRVQRDVTTQKPLRIIYAGRMEQGIKRVVDILAIAVRLADTNIPFELRLIGDGPHAGFVASRAAVLNTRFESAGSARITYESAIPPHFMNDAWQWADVFLLASRLEGFSIAMVEAMAAGCVPIVTRIASGPADIIREGENGWTFPIGDIDAAVDCIQSLAANRARMQSMSDRARESVAASLSPDLFADRLTTVIDAVVGELPRTWPSNMPIHMPPVAEPSGAIPTEGESRPYESAIRFIESRKDASSVVIYGLGVNGIALIDRLQIDSRMGDRTLYGADDRACAAMHTAIGAPRFDMKSLNDWPVDLIAIVTPNNPTRLIDRLQALGAVRGRDFTCLYEPATGTTSLPGDSVATGQLAAGEFRANGLLAASANASDLPSLRNRHQTSNSQPSLTSKRENRSIA